MMEENIFGLAHFFRLRNATKSFSIFFFFFTFRRFMSLSVHVANTNLIHFIKASLVDNFVCLLFLFCLDTHASQRYLQFQEAKYAICSRIEQRRVAYGACAWYASCDVVVVARGINHIFLCSAKDYTIFSIVVVDVLCGDSREFGLSTKHPPPRYPHPRPHIIIHNGSCGNLTIK